ncbi:MAG: metal ABC transporter permease, partial [Thermoanaerobaculia bacterium]
MSEFGLDYNTTVVVVGTGLLGLASGVIGTFAVLRRRALVGDALAHAALPGICIAFLLTGERAFLPLLAGAFLSGLLGVWVVSLLARHTRTKEDAAIGIVLSVFFGTGISLSRFIQSQGSAGSKAGLDHFIFGKTAGMLAQDVYTIAFLVLAVVAAVALLFKEFKLVSFDPEFGSVQGWPTLRLDLALMGLLALTTVVGLPAVGVVLMAALLIIPAAAARFWTEGLAAMLT